MYQTNQAEPVIHDALVPVDGETGQFRGFNRYWTDRAIALLRRVSRNPNVRQARDNWGRLDANGHGAVCANQVLIELLDQVRTSPNPRKTLQKMLPVGTEQIIEWNDRQRLTFAQIADKIEAEANKAIV